MRTILAFFLFVGLVFPAAAQIDTNNPARFKIKVVSYEGKIGSGVSNTSINPTPSEVTPGSESKNTVTSPGHESELRWMFAGRNGSKDVYHFTFTRMMKAGDPGKTTTSKDCSFDGRQIILFEDDLHTVVIESPSKEDLKDLEPRNHI